MILVHFGALCIALLLGVAVSLGILVVLAMADDRRHIRHGRLPLQPVEPIDLGQEPPEPGSEREANLLLARWAEEGRGDG